MATVFKGRKCVIALAVGRACVSRPMYLVYFWSLGLSSLRECDQIRAGYEQRASLSFRQANVVSRPMYYVYFGSLGLRGHRVFEILLLHFWVRESSCINALHLIWLLHYIAFYEIFKHSVG